MNGAQNLEAENSQKARNERSAERILGLDAYVDQNSPTS